MCSVVNSKSIERNMSSLTDFYADATVFVTGGTGYLGKTLVERLLRSVPEIKCIYLLMRTMKGMSGEGRLETLRSNRVSEIDRI